MYQIVTRFLNSIFFISEISAIEQFQEKKRICSKAQSSSQYSLKLQSLKKKKVPQRPQEPNKPTKQRKK